MDFTNALIPGRAAISIENMQAEILPKALGKEILQICKIFDGIFCKQFDSAKAIRNGKVLYNTMPMLNLL